MMLGRPFKVSGRHPVIAGGTMNVLVARFPRGPWILHADKSAAAFPRTQAFRSTPQGTRTKLTRLKSITAPPFFSTGFTESMALPAPNSSTPTFRGTNR
jgi:hypothetical protein